MTPPPEDEGDDEKDVKKVSELKVQTRNEPGEEINAAGDSSCEGC